MSLDNNKKIKKNVDYVLNHLTRDELDDLTIFNKEIHNKDLSIFICMDSNDYDYEALFIKLINLNFEFTIVAGDLCNYKRKKDNYVFLEVKKNISWMPLNG
ncbi:MAG: hypothetical protein RR585_13670 [Coprobacillus sp.]